MSKTDSFAEVMHSENMSKHHVSMPHRAFVQLCPLPRSIVEGEEDSGPLALWPSGRLSNCLDRYQLSSVRDQPTSHSRGYASTRPAPYTHSLSAARHAC